MSKQRNKELNVEYEIHKQNNTIPDEDYAIRTIEDIRRGLAKEIVEYFGEDMGDNSDLEFIYNTIYKNPDKTISKPTKDDLLTGILKFGTDTGLDNSSDGDGRWAKAVIEMAAWYETNIHEYNQSKFSLCSLINRKVRWDCSGFTTACLWLYGALSDVSYPPTSTLFTADGTIGKKLQDAGFEKLTFSWDTVQPFDIITYKGHVEIYNGKKQGSHTSWSWGSCHDKSRGGLPCKTAAVKHGYDVIWRNKYNGVSTLSMSNVDVKSQDFSNYSGGVISLDKLMKIFPKANRQIAGAALAAIDKYASTIGLSDKGKLFILAQMAHESANFSTIEEYSSGKQYEGRTDLGNTNPGDGPKYKGRGPIQVTGKSNYTFLRDKILPKLGINYDIVANPYILGQNVDMGTAASIGWFMLPGNGKRAIAAANAGDVKALTKAINGGYNGLEDRIEKTRKILEAASA